MRLVFYPPLDNSDLWSRRSSEPRFCRSSCSWRHSRHRAPPESSSRRWILRRWDTPARCNRAPSCRSQTGRECDQTDPGGYSEHELTEQSLDILFGWSTLKYEMLLVPSTTVTVRAIPVENTVRERVLIFLITVILRPRLTPVSSSFPPPRLSHDWCHSPLSLIVKDKFFRDEVKATRTDFLDYKTCSAITTGEREMASL